MKPTAIVQVNGKDRDDRWYDRLLSLEIHDESGTLADTCEIVLDARPDAVGEIAAPPIGAELKVWLGYETQPKFMGSFRVRNWTKAGPLRTITVEADAAALSTDIRKPKLRSHHQKTIGQIAGEIAAEHGLTAVVDPALAGRLIEHIDQQGESDVAFLTRLAKRQGATFKLGDGKILFAAKGSRTVPSGAEKTPITIRPDDVSTWQATCDQRGGYASASATYRDHPTGKRVSVKAGAGEPQHRDRRLYGSKAEAEAAAAANLGGLARGKMSFSLDGAGMPELFAEALVRLEGFDPDVDGDFLAKSVAHTFDGRGGFTTSVSLETVG